MLKRFLLAISLFGLCAMSVGCQIAGATLGMPVSHNLPPAERILEPGPGVGGPGPGVLTPDYGPGTGYQDPYTVQILFSKPDSMQVRWDVSGINQFDSSPLIVPGRQNFAQGGIFRLKLTNIEGREGVELYPSLEIGPVTARTAAYLAHNAIPIQFTEEDFDQVMSGNFVTKVIYLPDPEFQELALAGVDTLVSTRLDPGIDPIVEADRRGAILAIVRLGNKDEEMPAPNGSVSPVSYNELGASISAAPYGMPVASPSPGGGGYAMPYSGGTPAAMRPLPFSSGSVHQNYISGVTAPPYGMPISGTPIGLPGPPHIPLGIPAGLQKHVIHNHTKMQIPRPTERLSIEVQQAPGLKYPAQADKVFIKEQMLHPLHINNQPVSNMVEHHDGHHGHP